MQRLILLVDSRAAMYDLVPTLSDSEKEHLIDSQHLEASFATVHEYTFSDENTADIVSKRLKQHIEDIQPESQYATSFLWQMYITPLADKSGPYLRFEYDPTFWSGNYQGTGQFALVPLSECRRLGPAAAFQLHTHFDPANIIHYSSDELYNAQCELITL